MGEWKVWRGRGGRLHTIPLKLWCTHTHTHTHAHRHPPTFLHHQTGCKMHMFTLPLLLNKIPFTLQLVNDNVLDVQLLFILDSQSMTQQTCQEFWISGSQHAPVWTDSGWLTVHARDLVPSSATHLKNSTRPWSRSKVQLMTSPVSHACKTWKQLYCRSQEHGTSLFLLEYDDSKLTC